MTVAGGPGNAARRRAIWRRVQLWIVLAALTLPGVTAQWPHQWLYAFSDAVVCTLLVSLLDARYQR